MKGGRGTRQRAGRLIECTTCSNRIDCTFALWLRVLALLKFCTIAIEPKLSKNHICLRYLESFNGVALCFVFLLGEKC